MAHRKSAAQPDDGYGPAGTVAYCSPAVALTTSDAPLHTVPDAGRAILFELPKKGSISGTIYMISCPAAGVTVKFQLNRYNPLCTMVNNPVRVVHIIAHTQDQIKCEDASHRYVSPVTE